MGASLAAHFEETFLLVRVKPRAKRAGLVGRHGAGVKVAVRASPERGRANEELLLCSAVVLDLPPGSVEIVTGATSQDKRLRVLGMNAEALEQRLEAALRGS